MARSGSSTGLSSLCILVVAASSHRGHGRGACGNVEPFDYWGGDVGTGNATSVDACCAQCAAHAGCLFFSFETDGLPDTDHCLFKSNRDDRRPNRNRLSGARPGGPPTPLAPTPVPAIPTPAPPPQPPAGKPDFFYSCTANLTGGARLDGLPFCNASLGTAARVDDLLARLTDGELCATLDSGGHAVPRLGLPAMKGGESTHGVSSGCGAPAADGSTTGCPTSFPCGAALGASFDREVWAQVGATVAREARALSNQRGKAGLYFLDPNINLMRDPRWGRAQEVPGECPHLTAEYAATLVAAAQDFRLLPPSNASSAGDDGRSGSGEPAGRRLAVALTAKHFSMYDMEGYIPRTDPQPPPASGRCETPGGCERWNFDMVPPKDQFVRYYMPPFQAAAQRARVAALMCSYNSAFGLPTCANDALNNGLVRGEWGWGGFFVSDCTALELFQDVKWDNCPRPWPSEGGPACVPDAFPGGHNYTHSVGATLRAALVQGGIDYNCGPLYRVQLAAALRNGTVSRAEVEAAARRVFTTAVELGLLDPMDEVTQPLLSLGPEQVDSKDSRAAALRAASEALTLLSNAPPAGGAGAAAAAPVLPLKRGGKLAFIGPHANATVSMLSNYHGANTLVERHSPLQAAAAMGLDVTYARGCNICDEQPAGFPNMPCTRSGDTALIAAAVAAAAASDAAVLFLGSDQTTEAENFDRSEIGLAGAQEALLAAVLAAQPRTAVVLINGGPIGSDALRYAAPAVLEAYYPGELGGDAVVRALVGDVNPGGRLPYTVYPANFTARDVRITDLAAAGGVTYQYFAQEKALWPFGHGLSYTSFSFSWAPPGPPLGPPPVAAEVVGIAALARSAAGAQTYTVTVTNTGRVAGDCVVLAFSAARDAAATSTPAPGPLKALFGFERVRDLAPGAAVNVTIAAPAAGAHLSTVMPHDGSRRLLPGRWRVQIGVRGADAAVLEHDIELVGTGVTTEENEWAQRL